MLKILILSILSFAIFVPSMAGASQVENVEIAKSTKKRKKRSRKPRQRKTIKRSTYRAPKQYSNSNFALQAEVGYEAPYGNGISAHFTPWRFLDLNAGVGYNSSGVRGGVGVQALLHVNPGFGFNAGASISYSAGGSGNVSVSADFTPEGSSESESVNISKPYEISPTVLSSIMAGVFFNFSKSFGVFLNSSYTNPLSGNEVTLGDEIYYEDNLEVTNEDQIISELNERASEEAKIGGIGGYVGARIYL